MNGESVRRETSTSAAQTASRTRLVCIPVPISEVMHLNFGLEICYFIEIFCGFLQSVKLLLEDIQLSY